MKSNFTKSQEKLLERIRSKGNIVFATVDKGLEPAAVVLVQYINDALHLLQDEHTYVIISKEQTLQDDAALRLAI